MLRALPALLSLSLSSLAGCAAEELSRSPTRASTEVYLSSAEPGACCRALGGIFVESGPFDLPTHYTLREEALDRGANYVVLDAFSVIDEYVLARARLFACPALAALDK